MITLKPRGLMAVLESLSDGKQGAERDARISARFSAEVAPYLSQKENNKVKQAFFETFSLREAFIACTGEFPQYGRVKEAAIASSAYSIITSAGLAAKVIEAYNTVDGLIGDMLVTPFNSSLISDRFPGFDEVAGIANVAEGAKYPDVTIGEKGVGDTTFSKRGAMVQITEETILFDQTGQIMMRCNNVGRQLALDREKAIIRGVLDLTGNKSYYPLVSGTPTQTDIYTGAAVVATNPLVDWTSIDKARLAFLTLAVDSNSNPILDAALPPFTVLAPTSLEMTANFIGNATQLTLHRGATAGITGASEIIAGNPIKLNVLTSPILDSISTSTWYMAGNGGFKRQFIEKIHMPLQVVPVPQAEVNAVSQDIVAGVRARYKSRVFALDKKFVVQCNAA